MPLARLVNIHRKRRDVEPSELPVAKQQMWSTASFLLSLYPNISPVWGKDCFCAHSSLGNELAPLYDYGSDRHRWALRDTEQSTVLAIPVSGFVELSYLIWTNKIHNKTVKLNTNDSNVRYAGVLEYLH